MTKMTERIERFVGKCYAPADDAPASTGSVKPENATPATSAPGEEVADSQGDPEDFALDVFDALDGISEDGPDAGGSGELGTSEEASVSPPPGSSNENLAAVAATNVVTSQTPAVGTPATVAPQVATLPGVPSVGVDPTGQQPPVVPAAQQQTQPEAQVGQTSPLDAFRAEVEKNQEVFTTALAQQVYKLDDTIRDELLEAPEVAVPKLLARAHVEIVKNVLGTLAQQMPATIAGYMQAQDVHRSMEQKFYERWPQLDPATDGGAVRQLAAAYRQQNPSASFEDAMQVIGAQAVVFLGKAISPAAPVAPAQQRPARQVISGGIPPAGNGTRQPVVTKETNPWGDMADQLSDDF